MRKVILKAKSKRGKQIIKDAGNIWIVINGPKNTIFDTHDNNWVFIYPESKKIDQKYFARWVNLKNDRNFKVIIDE